MVSTASSKLEGPGFDSLLEGGQRAVLCSVLSVCSLCLHRFSQDSSHSPNMCMFRLTGD